MDRIFFTVLRSVAIPFVAYLMLREVEFLGEKGAILAIAIALTVTNVLSILWNIIKIIPNTLLFKGNTIISIIFSISIQLISLGYVWYIYLERYTEVI